MTCIDPPAVLISEVGPRDGLQSVGATMPTADKLRWIDALAGEEGPATRERKRLHLRAMAAGAGAHPDLRWSRGEMLTREAFLDGIAKIEGHRP